MNAMHWEQLTNDEKLDRITSVLTRAGSDMQFRERCLTSPEAAKKAVSEAGGIEFPPDFQVIRWAGTLKNASSGTYSRSGRALSTP